MTHSKRSIQLKKTDWISSNVESSQISVTDFNRLKQSVLYLVLEHAEEPEIADAQI
jgi:hypothetical protein